MTRLTSLPMLCLLILGMFVSEAHGQEPRSVPADRALLDRYCVTCHNQKLRTAGLALDTADVTNVVAGAEIWEKVIRKVRSGAMPPPGRPRPDNVSVQTFVSTLEGSLDRLAAGHPNPGRTDAFHRLTRTEYRNAVRDLLDIDADVAALLPADQVDEHGFENMAGVLSVSPVLLDRYLSAARKITRLAVGLPPALPGSIDTYNIPLNLIQEDQISEELPFGSRGGIAIQHYFPVDGEYLLKVRLQKNYVDYIRGLDKAHQLEVRVNGKRVGRFVVGGAKGKPAPISYAGTLPGDPDWEVYMHHADDPLEVRLPIKAGMQTVGVAFLQEQWEPEGILQARQSGFALAVNERGNGNPSIDNVVISGPYKIDGPGDTASRRKILQCKPRDAADEEACARRILSAFARRAYRRAATADDLETLIEFYRLGRKEAGFEGGIQRGLERLLVDPEFLFRIERDPADVAPNTPYRLSDLELASRLSFFLWSSIPDDELLDKALQGKLHDPVVLEQQVRRMLANERSRALVDNFAAQWLRFSDIASVIPDPGAFPEFDDNLRRSFQRETELFIESIIREDRSAVDLLAADYTFVNEQLARHYGIPGVIGNRFRRVTVTDDARRGLLGHGSILTVTSYPTRTSPVLRGKWLLDNILGTPPPPPPDDVPPLADRRTDGVVVSVRERLEQHRKNPMCATCHAPMDPLGFALESFDGIGRLRTHEGAQADAVSTWRLGDVYPPVDAKGTLPGGSQFEGPVGLRKVLLDRQDQFVGTLTEKLLTYALGRGLEYYDQPAVRHIIRDAAANDYRWSSLVVGIVRSAPFQMRKQS